MAKVITFSRHFPKHHPKAGQPTYFVEMIYKSLFLMKCVPSELANDFKFSVMNDENYLPKHHTIRSGNRFKKGEFFSPRVWSGIPYRTSQIIISEDIEIVNVWDIEIVKRYLFFPDFFINGQKVCDQTLVAKNDGLDWEDLINWFGNKDFKGQIICWNSSVEY